MVSARRAEFARGYFCWTKTPRGQICGHFANMLEGIDSGWYLDARRKLRERIFAGRKSQESIPDGICMHDRTCRRVVLLGGNPRNRYRSVSAFVEISLIFWRKNPGIVERNFQESISGGIEMHCRISGDFANMSGGKP